MHVQFLTAAVLCLLGLSVLMSACKQDKLPEPMVSSACDTLMPTWQSAIRTIVERKCATPGCHTAGFSSGDFTTYESTLPRIENGSFKRRTLDQRNMPPAGSPPLSEEELLLLECWLSAGYPQ